MKYILPLLLAGAAAGLWFWLSTPKQPEMLLSAATYDDLSLKKARSEYFKMILQDPLTREIPQNVRARELGYSHQLLETQKRLAGRVSVFNTGGFKWVEAGPDNVGGRTRAVAFDSRSSDILLAGGVSGGMWKTTDGGATWSKKTDPANNLSVTSIAQDPTAPDTWYYGMGEFDGNSASGRGAFFFGQGLYRSQDNGETWSLSTYSPDGASWVRDDVANANTDKSFANLFNFISRIVITPGGDIYICSNGFGIYRSTDDAASFQRILPIGAGQPLYSDLVCDDDGNLTAVLSENSYDGFTDFGIFRSTDDGQSWIKLIPENFTNMADFPDNHNRTVLALAPSNQNLMYAFVNPDSSYFNASANETQEYLQLFLFDFSTNTLFDRTANIPNFGGSLGDMNTQGDYNMVISVKPDDPNVVLIGGTNLYRSTEGFASLNDDPANAWIGGYGNGANEPNFLYSNHHPDSHGLTWDPNDPDIVISTHDGGISKANITDTQISWEDLNNGFNVTQFYTTAIQKSGETFNVIGGTQDNGSPFITTLSKTLEIPAASLGDLSSGDGSHCYYGNEFVYSSSQNGRVLRWNSAFTEIEYVAPANASGQLFIHPFEIDRSDELTMYYPAGSSLWVNNEITTVVTDNTINTTQGWTENAGMVAANYRITALKSTTDIAARLYYGAQNNNGKPRVYRLDDAKTNTTPTFTELNTADGSYINHIAVNEKDGNELMVSCSNYNIDGLFYSSDGGQSFVSVEGNLTGSDGLIGPSIRSSWIMELDDRKVYFAGTSAGLYVTDTLENENTTWSLVAEDLVGFNVVSWLDGRSDGILAVASHGRGIFLGLNQDITPPFNLTAFNISDVSFDINWEGDARSVSYSFQLASDADFSEILLEADIAGNNISINELSPSTSYFFRVNSTDGSLTSDYSVTLQIVTQDPLSAPVALPAINVAPDQFTAVWNRVDDALSYDLVITSALGADTVITGIEDDAYTVADQMTEDMITYRVVANDDLRTSDTSNVITVNLPPITQLQESIFSVYPNPFTDQLTIEPDFDRLVVYDMNGVRHFEGSDIFHLNLWLGSGALKTGTYLFQIERGEERVTKRLTKITYAK